MTDGVMRAIRFPFMLVLFPYSLALSVGYLSICVQRIEQKQQKGLFTKPCLQL
jgi:hypothetical protein